MARRLREAPVGKGVYGNSSTLTKRWLGAVPMGWFLGAHGNELLRKINKGHKTLAKQQNGRGQKA